MKPHYIEGGPDAAGVLDRVCASVEMGNVVVAAYRKHYNQPESEDEDEDDLDDLDVLGVVIVEALIEAGWVDWSNYEAKGVRWTSMT